MGALADATLAAGGKVIGVIPSRLVDAEIAHTGVTKLHVVETMHERKALMAELSDAVIALPGGTGTLDELFELFTWSQLGLHRMPIGLLDVAEYWQPLLRFLEHAVNERFLRAEHFETLHSRARAGRAARPAGVASATRLDKWLDRRDDGGGLIRRCRTRGLRRRPSRAGCRRSRRARGRPPRSRCGHRGGPVRRL